jgi:GTPase SAR1 family protein
MIEAYLVIFGSMPFGEIVCGSPGSGKSTYCYGKHQLLTALNRPISIVNLDPANESIPYPCAIDVSSLITLQDVMNNLGLGPNGAMLYCMEYLEENFDWLEERLKELGKDAYVVFDLPGQVELSTYHESLKNITEKLTKCGFRVRAFHGFIHHIDYCNFWLAGRGSSMRRALCYRCREICLSSLTLPQNDATPWITAHKRVVQGGSYNTVWRSRWAKMGIPKF